MKQLPCLPCPYTQSKEWWMDSVSKFRLFTMDAPGKVCFNSPLSRRQTPDHRPRKGGWPDERSCRVFPGNCRIIRDDCESPPRSVEFGASGNQVDSEGIARRTYKDGKKAKSKDHVVFSRETLYHAGQRKSPCWSEEHGAGGNLSSKGVSKTPCAPHASVDCQRLT